MFCGKNNSVALLRLVAILFLKNSTLFLLNKTSWLSDVPTKLEEVDVEEFPVSDHAFGANDAVEANEALTACKT